MIKKKINNFIILLILSIFLSLANFSVFAHLRRQQKSNINNKYEWKDGYRDTSYDPGYGLDMGVTGKDMYSGLGHINGFDKKICSFGDSGNDAKNIFDIGHKLAMNHRYRDSADCFQHAIKNWWKVVRNTNNPIGTNNNARQRFPPAGTADVQNVERHLKGMWERQRDRIPKSQQKRINGVMATDKNQVPPQLLWLKEQKAKNAGT